MRQHESSIHESQWTHESMRACLLSVGLGNGDSGLGTRVRVLKFDGAIAPRVLKFDTPLACTANMI